MSSLIKIFDRLTIIRVLRDSPLFNLSLASKELFHSNFWAWFFEQYPKETKDFFSEKTGYKYLELKEVLREQKNIDITLVFDDGQKVLIENKIKSIAYGAQLDKYEKTKNGKDILYLLSLYTPPEVYEYNFLPYTDLLELLDEKGKSLQEDSQLLQKKEDVEKGRYLLGLFKDYANFLNCLLSLTKEWQNITDFDFHTSFQKTDGTDNDYRFFQKLRIHDLFHKVKYNLLKNKLLAATAALSKPEIPLEPFEYFSHGTGAASIWYFLRKRVEAEGKGEIRFEVQIQDSMFRLMLISNGCSKLKSRIKASKVVYKIFEMLDEIELLEITEPLTYPVKGDFNQYGNDLIYRNRKLKENLTVDTLVNNTSIFFSKVINYIEINKEAYFEVLDGETSI